jgi:high affinity Mn2+ porin
MKTILAVFFFFSCIFRLNAQTPGDSSENWTYHFQFTVITQGHPSFSAKYSGTNSLSSGSERNKLSITSTLFLGRRLWKNAAIYGDEEVAGGEGLSQARGIAGFPNGETFRIGSTAPAIYVARIYLQQYIPFRNAEYIKTEDDVNQLGGLVPTKGIRIIAGKFGLADYFDNNTYSHDPRSQFMNWALMNNGAWDYPANTRGYTTAFLAELREPLWSLRVSVAAEPKKANGLMLDYNVTRTQGLTFEAEKDWKGNRPGAIRFLGFSNNSHALAYSKVLQQVKAGDSSNLGIFTGEKEGTAYGGNKYGFGINVEQAITKYAGAFLRAGWNDGKTATWAYTEIDRTISGGLNISGIKWKRSGDDFGIAQIVSGISSDHRDFLSAGLYGFIIGDGKLNYGLEKITEIYYVANFAKAYFISGDLQFVKNPAYNKDRGPVYIFALRAHVNL